MTSPALVWEATRTIGESALWLGRPRIARHLHAFRARQWWSPEHLAIFQAKRLRDLLQHAYDRVPFYQERFRAAGITPADIHSPADLVRLPLTTKEELTAAVDQGTAVADGYRKERLHVHPTTGSTGTPFLVYLDDEAEDERRANLLRAIEWYGHRLGLRNARLWRTSRQKTWKDRLEQQLFGRRLELTIYDHDDPEASLLSDAHLKRFCDSLHAYRPAFIDGYVSALTLLAEYLLAHGRTDLRPRAVVTGAEYLSPYARQKIEEAFGCPVYNRYGGTEMSVIAHECGRDPRHRLHIMSDRLALEVLRQGKPAAPGELGEIVVTDFTARAVPLIRFPVGDVGVLAAPDARCACGRGLPLLERVEGRINDLFRLPDGRLLVSQVWHTLFRDKRSIRQYQVIQREPDFIECNVVLDRDRFAPEEYARIKAQVASFLPKCRVAWNEVSAIPLTKGGKFRHTISEVPLFLNEIRTDYPPPSAAVSRIRPYTLPATQEARHRRDVEVLKLDWNEATVPPAPGVLKTLRDAVRDAHVEWYADVQAAELRTALATYTGVPADSLRVFNGSDAALDAVARAFVSPGDEVVIVEPTYDQFRVSVQIPGGIVRPYLPDDPWRADIEGILRTITPKTRLLYLVRPNNPTGFLYSLSDIQQLLGDLRTTLLVLDEAYIEFADEGSATGLIRSFKHLAVVRSFSKAFCLAGLRCGYLVSDPQNFSVIDRIRNVKDVNVLALEAAAASLREIDYYRALHARIRAGRTFLMEGLRALGIQVFPSQGNFLLLRVRDPKNVLETLRREGIYVRDRSTLPGLDRCLRVTAGERPQMERVLRAFERLPKTLLK